jgi:hypothetical protein
MADNTRLNPGVDGDLVATDDIAGVKHQRVKIEFGGDGVATEVDAANPLPVGAPIAEASATHGPKTATKTTTSSEELVAAPGVGNHIYVTGVSAGNTSGTLTRLDLLDDVTPRYSLPLAASGGGFVKRFNPPWKLTENKALNAILGVAVTDVRINIDFYVGT